MLERKHQEEQYDTYLKQFEPEEPITLPRADILEKEPIERWAKKHGVTLPLTELRNNDKSRAEYMRKYRRKPKFCPHCKKQI